MPPVTEANAEATILETLRALPLESQRAVLSYALFLQYQQAAQHVEADEEEWDRLANQPEKMARFGQWAQQALAELPTEPLDVSRL